MSHRLTHVSTIVRFWRLVFYQPFISTEILKDVLLLVEICDFSVVCSTCVLRCKKNKTSFSQKIFQRSELPLARVLGVLQHHRNLGVLLTLFQPEGAHYALPITASTPGFQNLTTALIVNKRFLRPYLLVGTGRQLIQSL